MRTRSIHVEQEAAMSRKDRERMDFARKNAAFGPIRSSDDVGRILGLSGQHVRKIEQRAISKIAAEIVAIGDDVARQLI